MKRTNAVVLILGALAAAGGCGSSGTEEPPRQPSSPAAAREETSHADRESSEVNAMGGAADDLQGLSAADRVAAKKQRICPVTGAPLGSMGEPYKLEVKKRTVFLCCEGCAGSILQDPDKYLKKLEEAEK